MEKVYYHYREKIESYLHYSPKLHLYHLDKLISHEFATIYYEKIILNARSIFLDQSTLNQIISNFPTNKFHKLLIHNNFFDLKSSNEKQYLDEEDRSISNLLFEIAWNNLFLIPIEKSRYDIRNFFSRLTQRSKPLALKGLYQSNINTWKNVGHPST